MSTLPHVPGSSDWRSFAVRGVTLNVVRGAGSRSVGFTGGGRDGDFVAPDAPETAVLDAMVEGRSGITRSSACERGVATDADLDAIEARLHVESGGPDVVTRAGDGSLAVALALLDVPPLAGATRRWSMRGTWMLHVDVPIEGDVTARAWAWGKDPGAWLLTTLDDLGVPRIARGGGGNDATLVVPRSAVRPLLERALSAAALGPREVTVTDTRAR